MNARQPPSQLGNRRSLLHIMGTIFAAIALLGGMATFLFCISLLNTVNGYLDKAVEQKKWAEQTINERGWAADSIEVQDLRIILEGPESLERDRRKIRSVMVASVLVTIAAGGWLYYSLRVWPRRTRSSVEVQRLSRDEDEQWQRRKEPTEAVSLWM